MKNIKKVISAILVISLSTSIIGCKKKGEDKQVEDTNGIKVSSYTAKYSNINETVSYTGEIKAGESVSVTSKVGAKAISVYANEGDKVNAGDVIAKLDSTDIELSYNQSLAAYNSAVAGLNMTMNSSTKQSKTSANQAKNSAQISYDTALNNYNREKELYDQNSSVKLAEQSYSNAKAAYERELQSYNNNASVTQAKNALDTYIQNLDRTQELFNMGAASQLDLDNAKNDVANATASYETVSKTAQNTLDNAYESMMSAEEKYKTASISSRVALDNAEAALKNAQNALKNAKENISLTDISSKESIETSKASVASASAALAISKNNLTNTSIIAPIGGIISSKNITVGQMVSPGVEIFNIKDSNSVDAEISVTESIIPYISQGTEANVTIKSADLPVFNGKVSLINTVKDEKTGLYTVRVSIPNDNNEIKVGMFADIELITKSNDNALVIPSNAILQEGDNYYVYIVDGEKALKRDVVIGIQNDNYSEIIEGLSENDEIVVSGKEYITEGNNDISVVSKEEE